MSIEVRVIKPEDFFSWDSYAYAHSRSSLYHLSGWAEVIRRTYGHNYYYLIAFKNCQSAMNKTNPEKADSKQSALSDQPLKTFVVGLLPLIHLKSIIFGNSLISIPFFDFGGILADDEKTEKALLTKAIEVAKELKIHNIELRHFLPLTWLDPKNIGKSATNSELTISKIAFETQSHKVRMLLNLPESSEILMKSFKAKLRSQIRLPIKEGLKSKIGGIDLLEDFYKVFSINMRDLGSPVHSKKFMQHVLEAFREKSRIVVIYKAMKPLACRLIIGFKGVLENPWASALRSYSKLNPNMLLYWTMLEYACDQGYRFFDFGRSTPNEGTYHFKEQWGATPQPLSWQYIALNGKLKVGGQSEKSKFDRAIKGWKKLPIPVTRVLGPMIRKHISL